MGKKLSSWERSQRQREKERLAKESRENTASRRAAEKSKKDKETSSIRRTGSNYVSIFESLLESLCNLTNDKTRSVSAKSSIKLGAPITFKYPGDLNYEKKSSEVSIKDFVINSSLAKLNKNRKMGYDTYKSLYGSFFGNLSGKTKKEYADFINKNESDFLNLTKKEVKRKEDLKKALLEYDKIINDFNEKTLEKLKNENQNRKEKFKDLESKIKKHHSNQNNLKNEINTVFDSYKAKDFDQAFGNNLPIKFDYIDGCAHKLLIELGKELKKDFYSSPSNNFKYGIDLTSEFPCLFLSYNEEYFPLPSEQQINSVKDGYSVRPLLKTNIESIKKNMVPGAALLYANYAFNTSAKLQDLNLVIGRETIDRSTGSDVIEWDYNLKINRSAFSVLNFDKIIPSETIKMFKIEKTNVIYNKIKWFSSKKQKNTFSQKIDETLKSYESIQADIGLFIKEGFNPPAIKAVNDALFKVKEISGENFAKKAAVKTAAKKTAAKKAGEKAKLAAMTPHERTMHKIEKNKKDLEDLLFSDAYSIKKKK